MDPSRARQIRRTRRRPRVGVGLIRPTSTYLLSLQVRDRRRDGRMPLLLSAQSRCRVPPVRSGVTPMRTAAFSLVLALIGAPALPALALATGLFGVAVVSSGCTSDDNSSSRDDDSDYDPPPRSTKRSERRKERRDSDDSGSGSPDGGSDSGSGSPDGGFEDFAPDDSCGGGSCGGGK